MDFSITEIPVQRKTFKIFAISLLRESTVHVKFKTLLKLVYDHFVYKFCKAQKVVVLKFSNLSIAPFFMVKFAMNFLSFFHFTSLPEFVVEEFNCNSITFLHFYLTIGSKKVDDGFYYILVFQYISFLTFTDPCDYRWSGYECLFLKIPVFFCVFGFSFAHIGMFFERFSSTIFFKNYSKYGKLPSFIILSLTIISTTAVLSYVYIENDLFIIRAYCISTTSTSAVRFTKIIYFFVVSDILTTFADIQIWRHCKQSVKRQGTQIWITVIQQDPLQLFTGQFLSDQREFAYYPPNCPNFILPFNVLSGLFDHLSSKQKYCSYTRTGIACVFA